jgi:hypothetical protein
MSNAELIRTLIDAGQTYKSVAEWANCCEGYVSAVIQRRKHGGSRPYDRPYDRKHKSKQEASDAS